ncbi:hypothetical protein [Escherichia coli]|uniref:hypothetical protein n=1 Tax=Escherichia coli TaxID=562 RepID=UPI001FD951BC|nr:hypothetical protein [Escherichia coli]
MADIQPIHVWDNYRFTRFEFPGKRRLTAGLLHIVPAARDVPNCRPVGEHNNLLECQNVAKEWRVRLAGQRLWY